MLSKSHPIILFIDRFGFSVYQDTLSNIPKFSFTPDLVANLDVVNAEQFAALVSTFIQINKIVPSGIVVILSDDVIYIKDLVTAAPKPALTSILKTDLNDDNEHKDEVQNFLENIPFEDILARVIKIENLNRIVAVNKDLVMTIIDAFAEKGSTIETITPSFMYGQNVSFTTGLTPDNIKVILGNTEILRLGNLLTDQEKMVLCQDLSSEAGNPPASVENKPQSRRQYILVGVFIILLVVLAIVYFTSLKADEVSDTKSINKIINQKNMVPTIAPTLIPTAIPVSVTPLASTASADLETINIKILHGAQSSGIAANLKSSLSGAGFQNVLDEISENIVAEKSSVVFDQNVPTDVRNNIIMQIRKIFPDISVLESQNAGSAVNISIGKS